MEDDEIRTALIYKCAEMFNNHPGDGPLLIEILLRAVCSHINVQSENAHTLMDNFKQAHEILNECEEECLVTRATKH